MPSVLSPLCTFGRLIYYSNMAFSTVNATNCASSTFASFADIFGIEILSLSASVVSNFTAQSDASLRYTSPSVTADGLTFCNVTVTYTHPEAHDQVIVESWLPTSGSWNERLYAAGGGGYGAGRFFIPYTIMTGAIAEGYATVTTDAGLGSDPSILDGSSWALLSPGNVNLQLARNFGATSLNEEAIIAKEIVRQYYGKLPQYSYFNGCSQGGRQGLALAQRYPTQYDGIVAGAPAINMPQVVSSIFWPQQFMNELKDHPYDCEVDAVVHAAIAACDSLDGLVDGIIAEPSICLKNFDPFSAVNTTIYCPQISGQRQISKAAAAVVNATWTGMATSYGRILWPGYTPGTNLTGTTDFQGGIAGTNCKVNGKCEGRYNPLGSGWMKYFAAKDAKLDVGNLTRERFQELVLQSVQEMSSFFGTDDPDLEGLKQSGGKLLTWHGLADDVIPPQGTENYYLKVSNLIPEVHSFFKHYEIPGLAHCSGGSGGQPTAMFEQLRAWVENGTEPVSSPVRFDGINGTVWDRIVCPHPSKAQLESGCNDPKCAACWHCVS
ncbi:unnamed protein product [Clonostachys chloroleuca]|uniref:Carboxylic ester hydrolase n=1 Tax=Clonostachys chloroleuca TaxID=1926264 RepID=A0AA35PUM4_9HYPO|nr:unnamed protein product [Clonostachys chloroleuca]